MAQRDHLEQPPHLFFVAQPPPRRRHSLGLCRIAGRERGRFAWLPRVGLGAYTVATIVGYLVIGPYFTLGWIAKGIELAILVLLAVDLIRLYGSPSAIVRAAIASLRPGAGPVPAA